MRSPMRGVRQDSSWSTARGGPSRPGRVGDDLLRRALRTTGLEDGEESTMPGVDARADKRGTARSAHMEVRARHPGNARRTTCQARPTPRGVARHLPTGCSSGSTASSDAALAGWHDRFALLGWRRPAVHPHRRPFGGGRMGEVTTGLAPQGACPGTTQQAKARRGRTPPAPTGSANRLGPRRSVHPLGGGPRPWRDRGKGQRPAVSRRAPRTSPR